MAKRCPCYRCVLARQEARDDARRLVVNAEVLAYSEWGDELVSRDELLKAFDTR